jgi:hypothetical protein
MDIHEMITKLIPALIAIESGGDPNAVGDNGRSLGILQIQAAVVQDVNAWYGTHYRHADAFEPAYAREICRVYLLRWATEKRLGRQPTFEDMARIWNGGPNGWKKKSTVKYWEKVQVKLEAK